MTTSPPNEEHLPRPGDLLAGKYRVERVLGRGGMGIVYAATHELLAQRVAVKLLLGANSADASARFLNEARAAARVQHENIARVMDVGTLANGMPYMVLELLDGFDLENVLEQRGRLPVTTAVDYVLQALEAVAQAHAVGIIHRDLKPANMFLARKIDGSSMIKVLDFGISKSDDKMLSGAKTSTQAILGSPYYMSPEQLKSSKTVDRRADIWSVGVILYQLISNDFPFNGDSVGALFASILEATPVPLTRLQPECPPGLEAVVSRCLIRDPSQRFDGAPELAEALAPFASQRGLASVERIRPLLGRASALSGLPGSTSSGSMGGAVSAVTSGGVTGGAVTGGLGRAVPIGVQSGPAWQTLPSQSAPRGRSPALWIVGGAIVAGAGLGAGLFFARGHAAPPRVATEASTATLAPAPAPSPAPSPVEPQAPTVVPVASVSPASASTSTAEAPAPPAVSARRGAWPSAGASRGRLPTTAAPPPPAPLPSRYDPTKDSRN